ncbi:MAG: hypothetical protein LQ352_000590 [Teloschistes flavicans]|nr:MAG: hypothetical protein LQ352_000590 [Teloschistes flavicans]
MFQRLKGAIDSRIAEEQARQRSTFTSPPPGIDPRRPTSRPESPAQRAWRPYAPSRQSGETSGRGPDPSEFEPESVIDDLDVPSESTTPRSVPPRPDSATEDVVRALSKQARDSEDGQTKAQPDAKPVVSQELPTDVRVKLRKLEKLEIRYHELLRSYRLAHARVQTIEAFEASLKENTPLTSISDPRSLVEYLNQLNLKGDMVLDELKRVTHDRDTYKSQVDEAEQRAREAWDEVANLRRESGSSKSDPVLSSSGAAVSIAHASPTEQSKADQSSPSTAKSPLSPAKSLTGSLPSLSIFSPKTKAADSPLVHEVQEDLFSYDDELPRLQAEVKGRDIRIEGLQSEVTSLKGDLAVTRESTQSMVQTLEEATRELNSLRDHRDRSATELQEVRDASRKLSDKLEADLQAAETRLQGTNALEKPEQTTRSAELEQKLDQANNELQSLQEGAQKSAEQAGDVSALQGTISALEREITEVRMTKQQSEKKVETLNSLLKNVRDQLAEKEHNYAQLLDNMKESDEALRDRISQLETDLKTEQNSRFAATKGGSDSVASNLGSKATLQVPEVPVDTPVNAKKKNKKKKKGPKSYGEQAGESQFVKTENTAVSMSRADQDSTELPENAGLIRDELEKLQTQLMEKDAALEKMQSKLKDQEGLQEEIEDLKDSLSNFGDEHVTVKARVKELQAEKEILQKTAADLERELAELQGSHASSNASADHKHQNLTNQFEDLKSKAARLQTDLSAAQQLASSRFKELSEMRTVMHRAQPELTSLRTEIGELKAIKEAHKEKGVQLKRLEARQEEMRADFEAQKRLVGEREVEIRIVRQQLQQESNSKAQAEDGQNKAQQEIQRLEMEKRRATESLDQLSKDLSKARDEITPSRGKLRDLEQQVTRLKRDNEGLKEDMDLKSAQYASAQSLMSSMRDQAAELAVQIKEARDRCESLDEEVADAHRLLSERSREGETMRRLLADIEGKADSRMREMKDRMETAIEERDRVEDEASTAARRRARELEDQRNKVREAERSMKRAEEDKEELENAQRDWRRRREELEQHSEHSTREAEEVRRAMGELRDALDGSEQQMREAEKQKTELRRVMEDTQHRLEKLQKSNKVRLISHALLVKHLLSPLTFLRIRIVDGRRDPNHADCPKPRTRVGSALISIINRFGSFSSSTDFADTW